MICVIRLDHIQFESKDLMGHLQTLEELGNLSILVYERSQNRYRSENEYLRTEMQGFGVVRYRTNNLLSGNIAIEQDAQEC